MRKLRKRPRGQPKKVATHWLQAIPIIWRIVIFVIGIPSLYAGIASFFPRVTTSPGEPLHTHSEFSAPWIISNDSLTAIHDVKLLCRPDHFLDKYRNDFTGGGFSDDIVDDEIAANGRSSHNCALNIPDNVVKEAIITTVVSFRPDFLWWRVTAQQSYKGYKDDNGAMHWSPYSRDKHWF
jgi:hypothetical protein